MEIRDGHFRRRNQVEVPRAEQVFFELRELARAEGGLGVDEKRRQHLRVARLARVQSEHEVDQRALEPRAGSELDRESGAGDLRGAREVEDAEAFADLPVRLRLEGEVPWLSPFPFFSVRGFVGTAGNRRVGNVGNALFDVLEVRVAAPLVLFERGDPILEALDFRDLLGGRALLSRGQAVPVLAQRLQPGDDLATARLESRVPVEVDAGVALRHLAREAGRVFPQKCAC